MFNSPHKQARLSAYLRICLIHRQECGNLQWYWLLALWPVVSTQGHYQWQTNAVQQYEYGKLRTWLFYMLCCSHIFWRISVILVYDSTLCTLMEEKIVPEVLARSENCCRASDMGNWCSFVHPVLQLCITYFMHRWKLTWLTGICLDDHLISRVMQWIFRRVTLFLPGYSSSITDSRIVFVNLDRVKLFISQSWLFPRWTGPNRDVRWNIGNKIPLRLTRLKQKHYQVWTGRVYRFLHHGWATQAKILDNPVDIDPCVTSNKPAK